MSGLGGLGLFLDVSSILYYAYWDLGNQVWCRVCNLKKTWFSSCSYTNVVLELTWFGMYKFMVVRDWALINSKVECWSQEEESVFFISWVLVRFRWKRMGFVLSSRRCSVSTNTSLYLFCLNINNCLCLLPSDSKVESSLMAFFFSGRDLVINMGLIVSCPPPQSF